MPKNIPDYLKLHVEDGAERRLPPSLVELDSLEQLCQAFQRATGWNLRYEPAASGASSSGASAAENGAGLVLSPGGEERRSRLKRKEVEPLATALAIVLGELDRTRQALWQREAELAAGVPVVARPDEEAHLAQRLSSALEAGLAAVNCQAAALYLLDEGTSELKLRAACGLPASRLTDPARPLRGSIADLEALLGHAVVIEDASLLAHWQVPEPFPAAVCVPVSTPSIPLGTLWVFSGTRRDFNEHETNLIELVAGRIAADLEREMLLTAAAETPALARDVEQAHAWQEERLPTVPPLIDDWSVAGLSRCGNGLASEFYDWSVLADGNLAVAIGDGHSRAISAGLSATALQAALKAHANYRHDAPQLLERLNDTLWSSSPGGESASLAYLLITPEQAAWQLALAGHVGALLLHAEGYQCLASRAAPLACQEVLQATPYSGTLAAGGSLVLLSDGILRSQAKSGELDSLSAVAEFLLPYRHLSADDLARKLIKAVGGTARHDRTVLVVQRLR